MEGAVGTESAAALGEKVSHSPQVDDLPTAAVQRRAGEGTKPDMLGASGPPSRPEGAVTGRSGEVKLASETGLGMDVSRVEPERVRHEELGGLGLPPALSAPVAAIDERASCPHAPYPQGACSPSHGGCAGITSWDLPILHKAEEEPALQDAEVYTAPDVDAMELTALRSGSPLPERREQLSAVEAAAKGAAAERAASLPKVEEVGASTQQQGATRAVAPDLHGAGAGGPHGSPPGSGRILPNRSIESEVNLLELASGTDLDGDGDVGEAGHSLLHSHLRQAELRQAELRQSRGRPPPQSCCGHRTVVSPIFEEPPAERSEAFLLPLQLLQHIPGAVLRPHMDTVCQPDLPARPRRQPNVDAIPLHTLAGLRPAPRPLCPGARPKLVWTQIPPKPDPVT